MCPTQRRPRLVLTRRGRLVRTILVAILLLIVLALALTLVLPRLGGDAAGRAATSSATSLAGSGDPVASLPLLSRRGVAS